jgi:hypothetical protein
MSTSQSELSGVKAAAPLQNMKDSIQSLARHASVEDDTVTTRSNSDDEHQPEERRKAGQQGHILDSYTKIWESYSVKDTTTVGGARGVSKKESPILGF